MSGPRFGSVPPPVLERPRRVLVVGATGRLGVAIAKALASRGDRLVLTARDPEKLATLADDLTLLGAERPHVLTADLRDKDTPDHIAAGTLSTGGATDVILACGPFPRTPLEDPRREDLEQKLTVHASAPL